MPLKLVLLGDSFVGKSSLARRFLDNTFAADGEATIGAAFITKAVSTATRTIHYEIWDTAGQERYRSLVPMYYRGAHAAVVVYDASDASDRPAQSVRFWIDELRQHAPGVKVVVAGNKVDAGVCDPDHVRESCAARHVYVLCATGAGVYQLFHDVVPEEVGSVGDDEPRAEVVPVGPESSACCV